MAAQPYSSPVSQIFTGFRVASRGRIAIARIDLNSENPLVRQNIQYNYRNVRDTVKANKIADVPSAGEAS